MTHMISRCGLCRLEHNFHERTAVHQCPDRSPPVASQLQARNLSRYSCLDRALRAASAAGNCACRRPPSRLSRTPFQYCFGYCFSVRSTNLSPWFFVRLNTRLSQVHLRKRLPRSQLLLSHQILLRRTQVCEYNRGWPDIPALPGCRESQCLSECS